jgi:hypothetical protein
MANSKELARIKLSGPNHVLQAINFRFSRYRITADQTHGRETGLPVDTVCGGHFPDSKEGLVCCALSRQTPSQESLIVDSLK